MPDAPVQVRDPRRIRLEPRRLQDLRPIRNRGALGVGHGVYDLVAEEMLLYEQVVPFHGTNLDLAFVRNRPSHVAGDAPAEWAALFCRPTRAHCGAHNEPMKAIEAVGAALERVLPDLAGADPRVLLKNRYERYRRIGAHTTTDGV